MKPTSIIIFGATGDLAKRKLIPGLFNLYIKGRLPENFQIVGASRKDWTTTFYRNEMKDGVKQYAADVYSYKQWQEFRKRLSYVKGDLTKSADFANLDKALSKLEGESANRLYYLSISPRFFAATVEALGKHGMVDESQGWRRVVIEKPFGTNLKLAQELNQSIHQTLQESQIYRIDHYLAKETVQNMLVFRFANAIFEPLWNRNYIDHVQITAAESVDVQHRAGYYDHSGVLRDMFQNHLMQLLALVAMEPPTSFDADAIRDEKVKVLSAVRKITPEYVTDNAIRAQYKSYREAEGVADNSETPTYAALRLYIDNWRWQNVPFYLRSGKAMPQKETGIVIQFKRPPHMMFPIPDGQPMRPNILSICIQPDEGIHLRFEAKVPDTDADMQDVNMQFHYDDEFMNNPSPAAYERLLQEALEGDASLFTRADGIEQAWRIIDPFIQTWGQGGGAPLVSYEMGSRGPKEADDFLGNNEWYSECGGHEG